MKRVYLTENVSLRPTILCGGQTNSLFLRSTIYGAEGCVIILLCVYFTFDHYFVHQLDKECKICLNFDHKVYRYIKICV